MRFQVDITGDFNNIVGLAVAQNFYINIECAKCRTAYKSMLTITEDSKEQVKVRGNKYNLETYNLVVKCRQCDSEMAIKLHRPTHTVTAELNESYPDEQRHIELFPVENGRCHISTVQSDTAVLVAVDGLILDAVDTHGRLYENCDFKDRVLVEVAENGQTVSIQDFRIAVAEL
ncbi:hypothetical protein PAPHI01_2288 [Pancytospora philotis]|nr:hypothetical protein PAPHI01_2288 [Pancytospora philotis]